MIAYSFLICWQFSENNQTFGGIDFLWVWLPIFYAFLLFFRLLIYCDVSEKNKILKQELTKLNVKSSDKEA